MKKVMERASFEIDLAIDKYAQYVDIEMTLATKNVNKIMMIFSLAKPCADDMDDQEAFEGDDFTFQIDCDGNPKPVAKWTKEGKGIDTKDGHFTITQADPNAYRLSIKGT